MTVGAGYSISHAYYSSVREEPADGHYNLGKTVFRSQSFFMAFTKVASERGPLSVLLLSSRDLGARGLG